MISWIYWDPNPVLFSLFGFPILWYGAFFAAGFWLGYLVFVRILSRFFKYVRSSPLAALAHKVADQLTLYIVAAAIIGARLGHFLFYEHPADYLADPLSIFRIRNGGLASHGAIVAIIFAVFLFCRRYRSRYPEVTALLLLDCLAAPAALAGGCIRIGNFFNQEILGVPTSLPWAIVFGHPADGGLAIPRHPAQLYEAAGYFLLFLLLWKLAYRPSFLLARGRLAGLFFILVFTLRLLVEFVKMEQSRLLASSLLTMGQMLSIPVIALGFILYFWRLRKERQ